MRGSATGTHPALNRFDPATEMPLSIDPPSSALPASGLLLLAAIAAATRAQGAFYASDQLLLAALLLAAAAAALWSARPSSSELGFVGVLAGAVGAWSMASAVAAHHVRAAVPGLALLAGIVVVLVIVRRFDARQRSVVADGVTAIGVAAALSGWVGVAGHVGPLAHVDQALWRAATTLTYANAAAGLLVPLALLALARAAESTSRRETMLRVLAVTTLLLGLEATFSRGGAFALFVGLAVLLGLSRDRRRLVGMLVSALVGSGIAIAGLLPGVPDSSRPHWALAIASAVLGLGSAAALAVTLDSRARTRTSPASPTSPTSSGSRSHGRRALLGWAAGAGVVSTLAVALFVPTMRHAVVAVAHPRLNPASSDRAHESAAALHEIRAHPFVGVGPGTQQLQWSGSDGAAYTDQYAHDEYLQMAWKSGLVGLGLVLAMFFAIGRRVVRGRIGPTSPGMWGGAVAGLAALGTASGFDFLWHLPVIPLVGALLAGLSSNSEEQRS